MGSALEHTQVQILQAIKSKSLKLQQVSPDHNELVPFYKDDIWVIGNISGLLPGDLFQVIDDNSISLYWKSTGQLFSKGFYYEYLDKNNVPYDSLESYKIATQDFFVNPLNPSQEEVEGLQKDVNQLQEGLALKADTVDVMQNKQSIATLESILSDVNVNQEAQVTTSGASPLSLPKNAANGGMSVKLEGLTAENLVVNGDFENGLIAPFYHDEGNGTSTLAINSSTPISGNYDIRLTITTPATGARPILYGMKGVANIGDKIYLHFYAKILSGTPKISGIHDGGSYSFIYGGDVINGRNTRIIDVAGTNDNSGLIYFNSPSVWDMQMDNFMRINLTETFGAGNEPTKEQCDKLFANYFEGTANTIGTGRVRSVGVGGINPSSLYFNGGTLRSNGLIKDEIRKGTNGYELVKRVGVGTLGEELITNAADREFASDTGWWTKGLGVIADGKYSIDVTGSEALFDRMLRRVSSIIEYGKRYLLVVDVTIERGSVVSGTQYGNTFYYSTPITLANGRNTIHINSVSPHNRSFGFMFSGKASIDNISLKEILPQEGVLTDIPVSERGGIVYWNLATPVITPIAHAGLLNSNSNGTVYFEPAVADAGVYGANIAIQLTDYPISAIESISKYEDGVFIPLNPATAVIAGDGLTFTHPDLASGDLVTFTYLYSLESTGRSMTLTHYDSRYVVKDTANADVYKITPKITSGELTWELTLV